MIHAVAGTFRPFEKDKSLILLHSAILNSLEKAKYLNVDSVSIPYLQYDADGTAHQECAAVLLKSCVNWLAHNGENSKIKIVRICNKSPTIYNMFLDQFN